MEPLTVLAQESETFNVLTRVLNPEVLIFVIPIVAIISGGIVAVTKTFTRHRERLAMIENGFDPDGNVA